MRKILYAITLLAILLCGGAYIIKTTNNEIQEPKVSFQGDEKVSEEKVQDVSTQIATTASATVNDDLPNQPSQEQKNETKKPNKRKHQTVNYAVCNLKKQEISTKTAPQDKTPDIKAAEPKKPEPSTKQDSKQSKKITLTITDSFKEKERHQPGTLGYHKFFTWFYPTLFVLKVNDTEVVRFDGHEFTRKNREISIDPAQPLRVHFDWEFLHGRKKGWRTTNFELASNTQSINIAFDWKDEWQVKIDHAKPIPESDRSSDNSDVEKK